MTEQKIGAQLDEIGLVADIEDGCSVTAATVHLTAEAEDGTSWHSVVHASRRTPERLPVPSPVEVRLVTVLAETQEITEEQRERIDRWLRANGIDPKRVARKDIVVESKVRGDREGRHLIGFTEFYHDEEGGRVTDQRTLSGAFTYQRWVRQSVPLEPDPAWPGWAEIRRQEQERET